MRDPLVIELEDASAAGEARRMSMALATSQHFSESDAGRVALVVTELATNVVKHARLGMLLCGRIEHNGSSGLEVLALDRGPGIKDPGRAIEDGFSTAGSPGTGLGAIRRNADTFDFFSQPSSGTAVLARVFPTGSSLAPMRWNGVSTPKPGEIVNGDDWAIEQTPFGVTILVVDGLGHGLPARIAATAACQAFDPKPEESPHGIIETLHAALRSTRGAAVAILSIDSASESARFAGIGNIAGAIVSAEERRSVVSMHGVAGHNARTIREFTYPCPAGAVVILHSDGLSSRWDLNDYPGLSRRDPALIAGVLWRDFRRDSDDATVVVSRLQRTT